MGSRRLFLVVSAGAILVACAGYGVRGPVPTKAREKVHSIAVASTLGNTFRGSFSGTTVFTNKEYEADVRDWEVDKMLAQAAVAILSRNGNVTAQSLSPSPGSSRDALIGAAKQLGADTLLVATPTTYDNQSDFPAGYGYHRKVFLGVDRPCVYSLFIVTAYNVESGRPLGLEWSFPISTGIPCYGGAGQIPWKDDFSMFTPAEKERLRQAVLASVAVNVGTSLKGLGLAP